MHVRHESILVHARFFAYAPESKDDDAAIVLSVRVPKDGAELMAKTYDKLLSWSS